MSTATDTGPAPAAVPLSRAAVDGPAASGAPALRVAGACALGAGALHAAAVGAHGDHRAAAAVFTLVAAAQLGWGATALVRRSTATATAGVLVGLAAFAGWVLAKSVGVPLVAGLDVAEPVQLADATAAGLAVTSAALAALALRRARRTPRLPVTACAVAVAAVTALAMTTVGSHVHPTGAAHEDTAAHDETAAHDDTAAHDETAQARPYDPALPIDLGGTPGVSPRQQAEAENLVAVTLLRLPQWADSAVAEAAGFRTIGDQFTGHEHLINDAWLDDDRILDPDRPEALVYDTSAGGRRLVAAMYMLDRGTPLDAVPDFGGALVQWHTHEDLCFSPSGFVQGLTDAAGGCPPGQVKPVPTPMVHVWIEPHRCGPFAALEGVAGGRIPDGQTRLCDHAHGAPSSS